MLQLFNNALWSHTIQCIKVTCKAYILTVYCYVLYTPGEVTTVQIMCIAYA